MFTLLSRAGLPAMQRAWIIGLLAVIVLISAIWQAVGLGREFTRLSSASI
jgi:hypothetical protein